MGLLSLMVVPAIECCLVGSPYACVGRSGSEGICLSRGVTSWRPRCGVLRGVLRAVALVGFVTMKDMVNVRE